MTALQDYFNANQSDALGVSRYLNQNGYTKDRAASEMGLDSGYIDNYFNKFGLDPWGGNPTAIANQGQYNQTQNAWGAPPAPPPAAAPAAPNSPFVYGAGAPGVSAPAPMAGQPGQAPTGYAPPAHFPNFSQNPYLMGGANTGGFSSNPNLGGMADDIGRRSKFQLGQAFNGIRSNSIGVGGLGGSRQGVAEGVATGMANDAYQGNLANLYGTSWNADQNRNLQELGMNQNFYTQQRGQDQTGAALGADLVTKGIQNQWLPLQQANSIYGTYTGNGTTTQSQNTGGGVSGLFGGVLGAAQLGKNAGWW